MPQIFLDSRIISSSGNCCVLTREHFYHVGGKEKNRNPVIEALVTNFTTISIERLKERQLQYTLFEPQEKYTHDNRVNADGVDALIF